MVRALDDADVAAVAERIRASGAEAIAVAFLFSFLNPEHEERAARILHERTGLEVTRSSQVSPELREYPRSATTAINASLLPLVGGYVRDLAEQLQAAGVDAPLHLMRSSGGVARAADAAALPVGLISSGPAAGVARRGPRRGAGRRRRRAHHRRRRHHGRRRAGRSAASRSCATAARSPAIPSRCRKSTSARSAPAADRSRASTGSAPLTVGPESAGADPGPAAYGMGGVEATVTDAHVVLGTLDPARFLGGRAPLDAGLAHAAIERSVAAPLGLSVEDAAAAVVRVLSANMAAALRVISVARGHDPRRFALVALGGAGPMHAPQIADELGIDRIVIPRWPGITAALGLLGADVRHDLARGFVPPAGRGAGTGAGRACSQRSSRRGAAAARTARGRSCAGRLDVRYRGQAYELTVPLAARPATDATIGPRDARLPRRPPPRVRPRHAGRADRDRHRPLPGARSRSPAPADHARRRPRRGRSAAAPCTASATPCTTACRWTRRPPRGPGDRRARGFHGHVPAGWTLRGAPGGTLLLERG